MIRNSRFKSGLLIAAPLSLLVVACGLLLLSEREQIIETFSDEEFISLDEALHAARRQSLADAANDETGANSALVADLPSTSADPSARARQVSARQSSTPPELRQVDDLPATEPIANELIAADSLLDEQDRQQIRKVISEISEQQQSHAEQADRIRKVIADHARTAAANGETVMELPPICLSSGSGWIGPATDDSPEQQADDETTPRLAARNVRSSMPIARPTKTRRQAGHASDSNASMADRRTTDETVAQNTSPHASSHTAPPTLDASQLTPAAIAKYNPHAKATAASAILKKNGTAGQFAGNDPHAEVFSCDLFPSATECRKCHEQIYDEWSSSSHAYASISPMFQKFEQKITELSQGTVGYFCMRCHAPIATINKHRRDVPIYEGPRVFREGVTCIACHRVAERYGRSNGERRYEPGTVYDPVYGGSDGMGVEEVIKYKDTYKVKDDPNDKGTGQPIHRRSIQFEQLHESTFCASCHQVAVQPGIKLEVVWDQYRASPAYRNGTTCQDCHMGKVPGMDEGYSIGPAALINGLSVNPERRHSNHAFYGPGYSIAHPGIFPQNPAADRWSVPDWLLFDWRGGWGTEDFEDALADGQFEFIFPEPWTEADDRMDAREIIDANLKKLEYKKDLRRQVMENGSRVNGPFFTRPKRIGRNLKFHYEVCNTNPGHNMPSGSLGAQPQLWLNVVLIGPDGTRIWESGYQDSRGDLADYHSDDVLNKRVPFDRQLFNLQTKFLVTNVKGTDREFPLPVNFDIDQIPFLRPGAQPITTINHPPFIRMEAHSISPLGSRNAKYCVPGNLIQQPGTYRLSVRLRSRAEPIYFMKFVESTPEMMRAMNEGIVDAHPYTVAFEVE